MKITDYLAIYAAALSSVIFFWNVLQSRPRLKVDLVFGWCGTRENTKSGVYIVIRNVSSHDVHLVAVDILYRYRDVTLKDRFQHLWRFRRLPRRIGWVHANLSLRSVESGCPASLDARKAHRVFLPESVVEGLLDHAKDRYLMASAQDQLWNSAYSAKFYYPVSPAQ